MQVLELLKITKWFREDVLENKIPEKYSSLYRKMNQNLNRNSYGNKVSFEEEKKELIESIKTISTKGLSLEQIDFIKNLKITSLIGENGENQIKNIFYNNNLDIVTAISKIKECVDIINEAKSEINIIHKTLIKHFEVKNGFDLDDDKVLMRVHFKNNVAINNLADLKKLSITWYDIGRGIAMSQNESPESFNVVGAKKGSIILEISVAYFLARIVSKVLLESLKVVERVVSILKEVEELKKLKLSNKKIASDLEKEAEKEKKEGTESILKTIIKELDLKSEKDGEKITALEKSINKLVDFTNKGGVVDFVLPSNSNNENEIEKLIANTSKIRALENKVKLIEEKINNTKKT